MSRSFGYLAEWLPGTVSCLVNCLEESGCAIKDSFQTPKLTQNAQLEVIWQGLHLRTEAIAHRAIGQQSAHQIFGNLCDRIEPQASASDSIAGYSVSDLAMGAVMNSVNWPWDPSGA